MRGPSRNGHNQHVHIWGKSTTNQQNDIQNNGYQQPVLESEHNDTQDNWNKHISIITQYENESSGCPGNHSRILGL
jgi:hypothetical protein